MPARIPADRCPQAYPPFQPVSGSLSQRNSTGKVCCPSGLPRPG
jgi:hypothetical protein